MASSKGPPRVSFFPKADAAVLSSKNSIPPPRPETAWLIYDPDNIEKVLGPWPADAQKLYPPKTEAYAPAPIPDKPACLSDRYLRSFLAEDERLRLSMFWYYTRDILKEGSEFYSGLQEKAYLAQESTGWEFVVIGLLDMSFYIRLATIGLPLAVLPRGEIICAHTVTQPLGSVFLLPNMMEDWRFQESPYVERGGLRAYAGAPLRLQNEFGDCVALGSLCVASSTSQEPLTKPQQDTLARLADWVVSDIVQSTRARRQRDRRRMLELIAKAQGETDDVIPEEPILRILRTTYPGAAIKLSSSEATYIEVDGRDPILSSDLENGLWEDVDYIDGLVSSSNHKETPSTRVVRVIAAQCENTSGMSLLVIGSKDLRLVFDDVDAWLVQTCASMISQIWHKRLLNEVMKAKEKFLRGFSHHLRTPIHGILGSAELLAEELKSWNLRESADSVSTVIDATLAANGEPSVYLDTIKAAGRDLISIVNSMITLNRWADIAIKDRQYAVHTIYDLETELANEIVKTFSGDERYRASIIFNHNLPPDCDSLRIDLSLLLDCLLPLIINAIQNTPEGIVMITVSIHSISKELIVDVEDTGRGIQEDHQQRIFEPYEKVEMQSTGAGLGLTLASKFATLLHGSVCLISSTIGGGSHFRAAFLEVECTCSPPSPQARLSRFENVPSKFYNMTSGADGVPLSDYIARLLTSNGFTSSDSMEGCLIIIDFLSDLEQRRKYFSQLPLEQVAICLVPASEEDSFLEPTPNNVIYARGPFSTSTMSSALEEADELLSEIRTAKARSPQANESLTMQQKGDEGSRTEAVTNSLYSIGQPTQAPTIKPLHPASHAIIPLVNQPDLVPPRKSTLEVSIFPAPKSSRNPMALLVDDNIINLRIMQMYCKKRRLPYCCAADGQQAIEMFVKHQSLSACGQGVSIQLILMDLQMPVCDGIEATRQIRILEKQNNWTETSLFIVTGQDSPTDRVSAENVGADEYLVKPVDIKTLDRFVKRHFPAFEGS